MVLCGTCPILKFFIIVPLKQISGLFGPLFKPFFSFLPPSSAANLEVSDNI